MNALARISEDAARDTQTILRNPAKSIARAAVAKARFALDRSEKPEVYLARTWPFDVEAQLLLKATTSPTDLTSGQALVAVAQAIGPMLAPYSAAAQLFAAGLQVTLSNEAGAFIVPGMGLVPVAFVADGGMKPVVQGVTVGNRIEAKKIAGITVATAELLAQESADTLFQAMLAESAGPVLDAAVFSNQAGTAARPQGLLYGVTPLVADTGGSMGKDIVALGAAVAPVAGGGKIALVANWAQILSMVLQSGGNFENLLLLPSGAVPPGTIVAVAVNAVVSAMGLPVFETGTQATVQMSDAPTPGLMTTTPVSSMFQTNSAAIKMHLEVDWAKRSPQAAAWVQTVEW